jgi:hypothetical protein
MRTFHYSAAAIPFPAHRRIQRIDKENGSTRMNLHSVEAKGDSLEEAFPRVRVSASVVTAASVSRTLIAARILWVSFAAKGLESGLETGRPIV